MLTMLLKAALFFAFRRGGLLMPEEGKAGAVSSAFIGDASSSICFADAGALRMVGVARVAASSTGAAGGLRVSCGPSTRCMLSGWYVLFCDLPNGDVYVRCCLPRSLFGVVAFSLSGGFANGDMNGLRLPVGFAGRELPGDWDGVMR
jgi:hypothetical protein